MATVLIRTKLYIPPLRHEHVTRPRLVQRLDRSPGQKLTLISAPAGFGKSALLGEWLAQNGAPSAVAWVSLDDMDNDPARFVAYVTTALQMAGVETDDLVQLDPGDTKQLSEAVLVEIINRVATSNREVVLVLDDYHAIRSDILHHAVGMLIEHIPPQLHLVISTRVDPPLALARLRARGEMNELRASDLRFSAAEASEFFNRVMGLDLAPQDVAVLEERTEGWIAGLQLAALSMRGTQDAAGFVRGFAGSHRYILDYLVEEVLARQPQHIQDFLLGTCVLDRLHGPLCESVCDPEYAILAPGDGQRLLERLEHDNLFVFALDDDRQWYRYHHLFADVLRVHLRQRCPEDVATYHLRAAEWYYENGHGPQAVRHALAGQDSHRAAHLIEAIAEQMLMRSEIAILTEWLEALPDEIVRTHPSLCIFHAWALMLGGNPVDAIEARLCRISTSEQARPAYVALRASMAVFEGRAPQAIALCQRALEQVDAEERFLQSVLTWSMGTAYAIEGRIEDAERTYERAQTIALEIGNTIVAVAAQTHLAELQVVRGRLNAAHAMYLRAIEMARDPEKKLFPIASLAMISLGDLLRERNELDAARTYLVEGLRLTRRWGMMGALDGYIALARIEQALGNEAGAVEMIERANRLAVRFDASKMDDALVTVLQTHIMLAQGDPAAAARWLDDRGVDENSLPQAFAKTPDGLYDPLAPVHEMEYIALSQVRLAEAKPQRALDMVTPLLARARDEDRQGRVIELLAIKALAIDALGKIPDGLAILQEALALAAPEGYVRVFVEQGPAMARLLYRAVAEGRHREYAGRLLAAFPQDESAPTPQVARGDLIEPLSAREIEVLEQIAKGCSNQEIANTLYISLRTVKWHSSNIYGKLGVANRTRAVARARAIGILTS